MKVQFHPEFKEDLAQAARYYRDEAGPDLANAFIDEVIQTLAQIRHDPMGFSFVFGDVRRAPFKRFKAYTIRYVFSEPTQTLFLGSLFHRSRHPGADKKRF